VIVALEFCQISQFPVFVIQDLQVSFQSRSYSHLSGF